MRRPTLAAVVSAAALCLASFALAPSASADPGHGSVVGHRNSHVCSTAPAGQAACQAIRHDTVDAHGKVVPQATPAGHGTGDIRNAYGLETASSGGKTVAIVDAYDDPNAASDLNTYRAAYGLPACNTGCFRKVSQTGSTTRLPSRSGGWAQEISLDLDMVSATCPDCHILLVEASTASFANLGAAVKYAASQPGVVAISNSYGGSDTSATTAYANYPNIAVTASTGDSGYGAQSPASFPHVIAVGGTSLTGSTDAWSETAWSGAGSGCSAYNTKPTWQTDATQCSKKADADVSAVADPNTGVAVYDSYSYQGASGWMVFGGTSVSSPIVASVYALAHNYTSSDDAAAHTWANAGSLHDVTSGSNGTCSTPVWCNAGTRAGWDGPTGLGTPNGTGAF